MNNVLKTFFLLAVTLVPSVASAEPCNVWTKKHNGDPQYRTCHKAKKVDLNKDLDGFLAEQEKVRLPNTADMLESDLLDVLGMDQPEHDSPWVKKVLLQCDTEAKNANLTQDETMNYVIKCSVAATTLEKVRALKAAAQRPAVAPYVPARRPGPTICNKFGDGIICNTH